MELPSTPEWNEAGQCYLVKTGVVSNPLTKEVKSTKAVICKRCEPFLYGLCERAVVCDEAGEADVPIEPLGKEKGITVIKRPCGAQSVLASTMPVVTGEVTAEQKRNLKGAYKYPFFNGEYEEPVSLNTSNRVGLERAFKALCREGTQKVTAAAFMGWAERSGVVGTDKVWKVLTSRMRDSRGVLRGNDGVLYTVLLDEIKAQLDHGTTRAMFLTEAFATHHTTNTGLIKKFALRQAPRTPQTTRLLCLFSDTPNCYEIDYEGFCHWMATDTDLLLCFVDVLFKFVKFKPPKVHTGRSRLSSHKVRHVL
eukprot:TRINITY_DN7899_c0_g1_i1.p1 TRINITY_DN7899_c0_g1~~TRINITY_DN7899_c0_g1_i1.p1  ORF type:complete len:334 (+),score=43.59 TRINITY_DN7899_c0_g1_i1:76-1002(+)